MVSRLAQPCKDGVGVDLEHAGDSADAQPFGQRAHRPHQQIGCDTLAMKRCAMGLQHIPFTLAAIQLTPRATVGMTLRTEIAEPHPPPIRTRRIGAELLRGIHVARASPTGGDRRWRRWRWRRRGFLWRRLPGGTTGVAGEARHRLGVAGTLARRWQRFGWLLSPSGTLAWPGIMQHDAEPEEPQDHELVEKEV